MVLPRDDRCNFDCEDDVSKTSGGDKAKPVASWSISTYPFLSEDQSLPASSLLPGLVTHLPTYRADGNILVAISDDDANFQVYSSTESLLDIDCVESSLLTSPSDSDISESSSIGELTSLLKSTRTIDIKEEIIDMCDNQNLPSSVTNALASSVSRHLGDNSPRSTPSSNNICNIQTNGHSQQQHFNQVVPTTMSILQSQLASAPANQQCNTALSSSLTTIPSQQHQFLGQNFGSGGILDQQHTHQQQQLHQLQIQQQQHSYQTHIQQQLLENQQHSHPHSHQQLGIHRGTTTGTHQVPQGGTGGYTSHHQHQPPMPYGVHSMANSDNNANMGMGNVGGGGSFTSSPPLNQFYPQTHLSTLNQQSSGHHLTQPSSFYLSHGNCSHSFPQQQMSTQRSINPGTVQWMGGNSSLTAPPTQQIPNSQVCINNFPPTSNNGIGSIHTSSRPVPAQIRRAHLIPRHPPIDPNSLPAGLEILWREAPELQKVFALQDVPDTAKLRGYYTVCELIGLKRQLQARMAILKTKNPPGPTIIYSSAPPPITNNTIIGDMNMNSAETEKDKEEKKKGGKRKRNDGDNIGKVTAKGAKTKAKKGNSKKSKKELEQENLTTPPPPVLLPAISQCQDGNQEIQELPVPTTAEIPETDKKNVKEENESNNKACSNNGHDNRGNLRIIDLTVSVPPAITEIEVSGGSTGNGKNDAMIARMVEEGMQKQQQQSSEEKLQNVSSLQDVKADVDRDNLTFEGDAEAKLDQTAEDITTVKNEVNEGSMVRNESFHEDQQFTYHDSGIYTDDDQPQEDCSLMSQTDNNKLSGNDAHETLTLFAAAAATEANNMNMSLPVPHSLPYQGPSHMMEQRGPGGILSHHQPPFRTLNLVIKMLRIGTYNIRSFSAVNPNRVKVSFSTQRIVYECQLPITYQQASGRETHPVRKILSVEYGFEQIQHIHFKSDSMFLKVNGTPSLSVSFSPASEEEAAGPITLSSDDESFLETIEKGSLRLTPYHEIYALNERPLQLLHSQMREIPRLRNLFT